MQLRVTVVPAFLVYQAPFSRPPVPSHFGYSDCKQTQLYSFRGEATFQNNDCGEGVAVYNDGDMT